MKLGRLLHKIVLLRPLLKLLGVKDKTVAAKVGEGLEVIDKAVNEKSPDETLRGDAGIAPAVVYLIVFVYCLGAMIFMS